MWLCLCRRRVQQELASKDREVQLVKQQLREANNRAQEHRAEVSHHCHVAHERCCAAPGLLLLLLLVMSALTVVQRRHCAQVARLELALTAAEAKHRTLATQLQDYEKQTRHNSSVRRVMAVPSSPSVAEHQ